MRPLFLVPALALTVAVRPCPAAGQETAAIIVPVYTHEQAEAGEGVYRDACADCHLANLRGDFEAPELAGRSFRRAWGNEPIGELLENIRSTMPEDAPESLSDAKYAAVVAYIIRENGGVLGGVSLGGEPTGAATPSQPGDASPGTEAAAGQATGDASTSREDISAPPVIPPTPGRPGTGHSPHALTGPPAGGVGDVTETPTGVTRTWRPAAPAPASDADLADPPAADWLHWRGNPGSWGMEDGRSQQAPLVRDGVLFLSNPGNVVQALDAADGTPLWEYRRRFEGGPRGQLRTLAIWEDIVYVATADAHMVALDAATGTVRWETRIADPEKGYSNSTGPSWPTAGSSTASTAAAASTRRAASSPPRTPAPAANSGAPTPWPGPASPAATPGATCPSSCAAGPMSG